MGYAGVFMEFYEGILYEQVPLVEHVELSEIEDFIAMLH